MSTCELSPGQELLITMCLFISSKPGLRALCASKAGTWSKLAFLLFSDENYRQSYGSSLSRASLTTIVRPLNSLPFSSVMAFCPSLASSISTKPKPLTNRTSRPPMTVLTTFPVVKDRGSDPSRSTDPDLIR